MSVTIKFHRGTNQIGGTITEIYTEHTHIFIDFGSELSVPEEESTDKDMVRMIQNAKCDGVLFTHYHGDHIGLMGEIPEKDIEGKLVRLAIGRTSRQVLINIHKTLCKNQNLPPDKQAEHIKMLQLLNDTQRWENLCDGKAFDLGDFKITPVSVDHSAYDAFLFIIEAEGKCIVHTGDFRAHGRLGQNLFKRLAQHLKGKRVDVLLTEGTMMSRLSEKVLSEKELEKRAIEELKKPENKYAFLICSSTNMESLASFHNAALSLGRRFFVNYYVKEQLELYSETAGRERRDFSFIAARAFEPIDEYNRILGSTQMEYMKKNGFLMLVGESEHYTERMEYFRQEDPEKTPLLIYSMWGGYLDEDNDAYKPELKALYDRWPRHLHLHTSGHACKEDIEEMIQLVNPKEAIIPIHTEKRERFAKLSMGSLREKVKPLSDGDCYRL